MSEIGVCYAQALYSLAEDEAVTEQVLEQLEG